MTLDEYERQEEEKASALAVFDATHLAPVGKRPRCQQCGRELAPYPYRVSATEHGKSLLYGREGDGSFCNERCGYRWAIRAVQARAAEGAATG